METNDLSHMASILRPVSRDVTSGKGILCLSTAYLHKLNSLLDENILGDDMSSSFRVLQTNANKSNSLRDLQFLSDLLHRAVSLKIVPDVVNFECSIDISKFESMKLLEVHKVDINMLLGLQKLRSQLQHITFTHCLGTIQEILDKCAGDNTNRFTWNELKQANFSQNGFREIDDSFECTPWLHTLDLSHNELTEVNMLSCLPNLKHLNLSYNKLDSVPQFRGLICNRIQSIILKHNFIEEIQGLSQLVNVLHVDLSQNCILDHKSLLAVSHLVSLQWLSLLGNPISFHPHHRNQTCNYLNKNIASTRFCLDNIILSKSEKSLVGSLYPIKQTSLASSHNSSEECNINSLSERSRRVRNVTIEDDSIVKEDKPVSPSPKVSSQHLEIKKQVEQLRQEYGETWLRSHSGLLVQDVLGIEKKTLPMSSTPYESAIDSLEVQDNISEIKSDNLNFETANDESFDVTVKQDEQEDVESEESGCEDVYSGGEECMYLATIQGETDNVFVVVTESHISERDCATSKETARWHINTVVSCEFVDESKTTVKINFNTVRRDRKQRIYELEEEEAKNLTNCVKEKMAKQEPVEVNKVITYQCMKCSESFTKVKNNTLMEQPTVNCPKCDSNLVIETA